MSSYIDQEIQKGSINALISLDMTPSSGTIDLTGAADVIIMYRKPDGTMGSWEADVDETGSKIEYLTKLNDLDVSGIWDVQANFSLDGWVGPGPIGKFRVLENIG